MINVRRSSSLIALTVTSLLACGPVLDVSQDGSSTGDAAGSTDTPDTSALGSTNGTTPTPTTAVPDPPQPTTGPMDDTTGGFGSSDSSSGWDTNGCGFIGCHDAGESTIECDVFEQNCPEGEKCAAWANDGGSFWNATRCVPVARSADLPGEPCTVEGSGVSGVDSCALGSMCWNVDPGTLEGACIAQCTGTWEKPTCTDPTETCQISGEGVLNLCHPSCDPVTQADCAEGQGCYASDASFFCAPDASGDDGAVFADCEFLNDCDPGAVCVNQTLAAACEVDGVGCCLPWCDVFAPDCPGEMVCAPWFLNGNAPPGSEFIGLCIDE